MNGGPNFVKKYKGGVNPLLAKCAGKDPQYRRRRVVRGVSRSNNKEVRENARGKRPLRPSTKTPLEGGGTDRKNEAAGEGFLMGRETGEIPGMIEGEGQVHQRKIETKEYPTASREREKDKALTSRGGARL